ncbi:MAG TPA: MATE family efflux transporter [Methanocella sp.]|nr:MATE family efflux transporter [Methanocella sp.]
MALVPYFITTLGRDAYSIIGLAVSITAYVTLIVLSLNTAVSRFLTVDLQKNDYKSANKTFNTAIIGLSALVILMIPLIIIIAYNVPHIFNIPPGQDNDVRLFFLGVFTAFLITTWTGNFTVQLFALNRIDLQIIVNATIFLTQNGLIVLFFHLYHPSLAYIGIAYPIGAICSSMLSIIFAKRVCTHLHVLPSLFDFTQLKTLFDMSIWAMIDQLGTLLFLSIDMIIINKLFFSIAGQYYPVLCISAVMRNIASTISGVLVPIVYTYYARNQIEALINMVVSAVKIMGIFMALPIGLLCGFSTQILTIWLPNNITPWSFAPLLMLMAFPLTINLSILPLFSINYAYNKIKVPGIMTLILGAGNFALAVAMPLAMIHILHLSGIAFYGVALAGAIMISIRNAVFIPWYAGRIMGVNPAVFFRSMTTGVLCTIIVMAISLALGKCPFIHITSFITLIPIGGIIGVVYLLMAWKFAFSSFERWQFKNVTPPFLRRVLEGIP